jgi:hypothetical protein
MVFKVDMNQCWAACVKASRRVEGICVVMTDSTGYLPLVGPSDCKNSIQELIWNLIVGKAIRASSTKTCCCRQYKFDRGKDRGRKGNGGRFKPLQRTPRMDYRVSHSQPWRNN